MRALLFVPDETGRRAWARSGLLGLCRQNGHTVSLLGADEVRATTPPWRLAVRRGFLRTCSYVARAAAGERTYAHKLAFRKARRQRLEVALARAVHRLTGDAECAAAWLESWFQPSRFLTRLFRDGLRPDVVVAWTSVYEGLEHDLFKAAHRAGIPTVAHIASWDTLTAKGGFLVRPDYLLVWGEVSKQQAVERHGFRPEQVIVAGAPHMDAYADGLTAPPTQTLLFAGTSVAYLPEEQDLVTWLDGQLGRLGWMMLYRPHPRRAKHDFTWVGRLKNTRLDTALGVAVPEHYRKILEECGAVVSAFSTLVIEAALFGRPSFLIGFGDSTGGSEHEGGKTGRLLDHMEWEHMRVVTEWKGVYLCTSREQLSDRLRAWLRVAWMPQLSDVLRRQAQAVVRCDGRARERIVEALDRIALGGRT